MQMPSYQLILKELQKKNPNMDTASEYVIGKKLFEFLLSIAVSASEYDETFYVEQYADVRAAIEKGKFRSGREHYLKTGYREGRRGALGAVDEEWYRATYSDVRKAVEAGKMPSGADHFKSFGWKEGRSANPTQASDINLWLNMLRN